MNITEELLTTLSKKVEEIAIIKEPYLSGKGYSYDGVLIDEWGDIFAQYNLDEWGEPDRKTIVSITTNDLQKDSKALAEKVKQDQIDQIERNRQAAIKEQALRQINKEKAEKAEYERLKKLYGN